MPSFSDLMTGKVKLEFGNPDHIAVIDRYQERIEKVKERYGHDVDPEKVFVFEVEAEMHKSEVVKVEALDKDDAIEAAKEALALGDDFAFPDDADFTILSQKKLSEVIL